MANDLTPIDAAAIRKEFPILSMPAENPYGRIIYLDSAASSQRPTAVTDAMTRYYETTHANVHRGVYAIAEEATREFEAARVRAGRFIGAPDPAREVVFAKNVTEAINLVAYTWARRECGPGDVIVLTEMEHHANLVPWLMLAEERGVLLRFLRVTREFTLDLSDLDRVVDGARLVCVTGSSNVLGTVPDLAPIVDAAHRAGALVLVDGAQLVPHRTVDVAALGVDFFGFTGHKMLGPTGIGVLWGRAEILESMPPFLGGGEMILDVRTDGFRPNEIPWRFEAGTPPIAEAIGLGAAIEYLEGIGLERIHAHENALTTYALDRLTEAFPEMTIHGPPADPERRAGVISFSFGDTHPHDVAHLLDGHGVCVRAGHHCAKPLMRCLGISAASRASFYFYNDEEDVDALVDGLRSVRTLFS
jgi:cysteine desulfurase/selenocysteine lyase